MTKDEFNFEVKHTVSIKKSENGFICKTAKDISFIWGSGTIGTDIFSWYGERTGMYKCLGGYFIPRTCVAERLQKAREKIIKLQSYVKFAEELMEEQ